MRINEPLCTKWHQKFNSQFSDEPMRTMRYEYHNLTRQLHESDLVVLRYDIFFVHRVLAYLPALNYASSLPSSNW